MQSIKFPQCAYQIQFDMLIVAILYELYYFAFCRVLAMMTR